MDTFLLILIGMAVGILGGGYLGYRYGRSVELKAQQLANIAKVTEVEVKKVL